MIQRAANEVGFEAEDIPLMVEAIPMANESVMLIITKMEDPEELDTRFSKFSPEEDENDNGWGNLTAEVLEGADGLINILTQSGILKPEGESSCGTSCNGKWTAGKGRVEESGSVYKDLPVFFPRPRL